ncbi:MAG: hypothetical protein AAFV95_18940 [Bacteroidota bacterium]
MYDSRLSEVFRSLSKAELKSLDKYIHSAYFNQREDVCRLFVYLRSQMPEPSRKDLDKRKVSRAIYGPDKYEEKRLSYTMSFLYQHLKDFLALEAFKADDQQQQLLTSRAFRQRGLHRQFESEVKILEKTIEKNAFRNMDYHYDKFQLQYEKSDYLISQRRQTPENLLIASEELITYFLANQFKLGTSIHLLQRLSQDETGSDVMEELLRLAEQGDYLQKPAVALYYYGYKALTAEEPALYFSQLRQLIGNNHPHFRLSELRDIYMLAINHGIKQYNQGQKQLMEQVLDLYKEGLELKLFIRDGVLSKFTYNNIVIAGLVQKEFAWVEQFLFDYKVLLDEKDRESSFNYNLAILYYRRPDYAKAMELLRSVEFKDVMHDLYARRMLLKMYYELAEYDPLASLLISFRAFIYRHKELGYYKSNYLNLIRFTNKLLQLDRYDKNAVQRLAKDIEQTKAVAEKAWLLEQLGQS